MTEQVDTIIVGGGQGGLSASYFLKQQGREHVVLEHTPQAAQVWRNRWDSFTLNTPNWMTRMVSCPEMRLWPTLRRTSSGSGCRLDTESG